MAHGIGQWLLRWVRRTTEGWELSSDNTTITFQPSPIVEGAKLFTNEPAVKFTAIAQSGTSWNATIELKDGDTEVQLAEAKDAYAQFVKVGTQVTDITDTATITAAVNAEKKIVLTITPPTGDAGFIKFTTATKSGDPPPLKLRRTSWRKPNGQDARSTWSPPAPPESNNRTI